MLAQNIFGTEYRPAGFFRFVQSISILSILHKWLRKTYNQGDFSCGNIRWAQYNRVRILPVVTEPLHLRLYRIVNVVKLISIIVTYFIQIEMDLT
jgi:hypothetical protein